MLPGMYESYLQTRTMLIHRMDLMHDGCYLHEIRPGPGYDRDAHKMVSDYCS